MSVHLTIDLDYWTMFLPGDGNLEDGIKTLKKLARLDARTDVVWYHHHILPYIGHDVHTVINVDSHDDCPRQIVRGVGEGCWASPQFLPYVREYRWYYNYAGITCDMYKYHTLEFEKHPVYSVKDLVRCAFWPCVTSATVCLSPNWVERMEVYKPLRKLTFELFGRPKRHGQALKA